MKKITRIKYSNHPVLKNLEFNLVNTKEVSSHEYKSIIIGQNGTGKSKLLESICSIIIQLYELIEYNKKLNLNYGFELDLYNEGSTLTIEYKQDNNALSSVKPLQEIKNYLPSKIIVNAYTFNEKYTINENLDDFYSYCGLKTVTNSIFINQPIEKTYYYLTEVLQDPDKTLIANEIFEELKFSRRIKVIYTKSGAKHRSILKNKDFLALIKSIKNTIYEKHIVELRNIITELTTSTGRNRTFRDTSIKRIIDNDNSLRLLLEYFHINSNIDKLIKNNLPEFEYNWEKDEDEFIRVLNLEFINHIEPYRVLKELGIIRFNSFNIYRNEFFEFGEASSGEFHLLHTFISILSNIKDNSFVLIDEPEISLHPNWQNKTLHLLNPIFERYPNSHFLIATHSHFLVSSLKNKESTIVGIKRDKNNKLEIRNLEQINPFGWSAEQILFEIFGMVTDRNYYLSSLVQEIINEMSKRNPNSKDIDKKISLLKEYDLKNLHEEDPFKSIIENLIG